MLISASASASLSMSAAVLNGPGLTRTVPSGNVPMARWMYGAQCNPGRMAMSNALVENAADLRGRQRFAAKAERADAPRHVAMAEHLVAADLVQPPPEPFDQFDFVRVNLAPAPCSCTYWMPAARPATPRTLGVPPFEEVRELARLRFAGRVAAGAALAPGADIARGPDVQGAGAGRPQQRLVAGKGEQVDVHRLHVDRHDAGRLGGIDEEEQFVFASDLADRLQSAARCRGRCWHASGR